ncbi:MAG: PQQ-binding-like beta-propeller repeat protein [Planctomycetota bacterium]
MPRLALSLLVTAAALGVALAQEAPPPLAGWQDEVLPPPPPPEPSGITRERPAALDAASARLLATGAWDQLGALLEARARDPGVRARLTLPPRGLPRGCWPDATARLRRWPAARAEVQRRLDAEAEERLRDPDDPAGARRAVVARWPLSKHAVEAASWLSERAAEEGRAEEALAWARRALELEPAPELAARLARRLVQLRARATHLAGAAGALGVARPWDQPLRLRWARRATGGFAGKPARRAVAADGERVYLVERGRVVARAREDGRLAWTGPLLEEPRELRAAHGLVLHLGALTLTALDAEDGSVRWRFALDPAELTPGEGLADLAARPAGLVASLRRGDRWELVGLDLHGKATWRTPLWAVAPPLAQAFAFDRTKQAPVRATRTRRVLDDGRIAALGDLVFVTAAGRVAALGAELGELRWARERLFGLGLDRGPTRVALRADAFGLDVYTAHGLLVRVDPRDGASLPLPEHPSDDKGAPRAGYLIALRPLVVGWEGTELEAFDAERRTLGRLASAPCWRGAALGRVLALPMGEGLELLDADGAALGRIPWPLGPAALEGAAGALLLANEQGVALLEPAAASPAPQALGADLPAQVRALGDADWRARAAAAKALEERLARDAAAGPAVAAALKSAALPAAARREAEWALSALEAELLERRRWAVVLPQVPFAEVSAAARDSSGEALRALGPRVAPGLEAAAQLKVLALTARTWPQRLALLELLLRADPRVEGRLVAILRHTPHPGLRRAALDELVRLAAGGGSRRGLRLALQGVELQGSWTEVFPALRIWGSAELWNDVRPKELAQVPFEMLGQVPGPGTDPDPAALWSALGPAIAPERR